jgi:hypothetical protein
MKIVTYLEIRIGAIAVSEILGRIVRRCSELLQRRKK